MLGRTQSSIALNSFPKECVEDNDYLDRGNESEKMKGTADSWWFPDDFNACMMSCSSKPMSKRLRTAYQEKSI